jgi:RIO kinase 2
MPEETEISNSVEPGTPVPSTSHSHSIKNPSDLKLDELQISDLSDRSLSRSPPRSQRQDHHTNNSIKTIVASDMTKKRSQQQRKYHSKRSTRNAGRQTGSKAKQDKRVKLGEHRGVWD